ncbi:hypothetical protein H5U35_04715 [Candidatus Aerophobetes bacterium]|nr:hypothetical protein [Candidatus Aerophobetes bacterium]
MPLSPKYCICPACGLKQIFRKKERFFQALF